VQVHEPAHLDRILRAGRRAGSSKNLQRWTFIVCRDRVHLEELAAARGHEFAFVCLPLKIRGATGSPVRPIAIA